MQPITTFTAKIVGLPIENIDTDQIIPARYLKVTDKAGLGEGLFTDWRRNSSGQPNSEFVLNRPETQGAQILVAGHNFGSGSSREHAPWALLGYGFKAVISTYFADIFQNNALKNGLLPIVVDKDTYDLLINLWEKDPQTSVTIDLANQNVILPNGQKVAFPIDSFAKYCLVNGVDQLGFLLQQEDSIANYEKAHLPMLQTIA